MTREEFMGWVQTASAAAEVAGLLADLVKGDPEVRQQVASVPRVRDLLPEKWLTEQALEDLKRK